MAKVSKQFTEDANEIIEHVYKPRNAGYYFATVYAFGTFGGGTVKLQVSLDDGATKIDLLDENGDAVSFTSAGMANIKLGGSIGLNEAQQIFVDVNGSTSADVTVAIFNNL